jgi:hypothetical protein
VPPEPTILLILLALVALVGPVTRWFGRGLQSLLMIVTGSPAAALYGYHALLLPGTLLHELSHLGMAWLLRVPTGRMSLRPEMQGSNMAQFGSVEIGATDPVRESLIGLAPLLTGLAALYLIARWQLSLWPPEGGLGDLASAWARLAAAHDPALWLYVVVAIGNAMLPSASDRRAWWKLGLALGLAVALLYAGGLLQRVPPAWVAASLRGAQTVALILALLLFVDLVVGAVAWLLTHAIGRLAGRRLVTGAP